MLSLHNICKHYDNKEVLSVPALNIAAQKTTVFIGPSGCGKSTLIRLINGLIEPSSGHVNFNGQTLSKDNILALRQRMGYVIQEGGLFPHLNALDNVTLMAIQLGQGRQDIQQRVQQLAELVQLSNSQLQRYPTQLSGGQRQRVALMRALMLDPELLLLDEPLGALDPMIRYELQQQLRNIFIELNKTVLLVTHDLNEAAFFADNIILLKDGQIVQQGLLKDFIEHPVNDFVSQFVQAQKYQH